MEKEQSIKAMHFLSGNEAIALGAYEAGVKVASSYPGTPSTEILENLARFDDIYTEWAPNEKVAVEVAQGASFAGARSLASMKHVGLNVAADTLFTSAYTGVRGGLVIVTADDPAIHSSQNEQDNRNYAYAAKVPMLEPADPSECKEFTKKAFALSEEFDIPVLLRTTTRVSHSKGLVSKGDVHRSAIKPEIVRDPEKYVMLPPTARQRRVDLEHRLTRLARHAESSEVNRTEWGDARTGFITSGISYLYVKETFPEASVLKLGMVYPLPEKMIKDFVSKVDEVIIVEELDPFIEIHVKAMGIACKGKQLFPSYGEFDPYMIRLTLDGKDSRSTLKSVDIPARPPAMCPGCLYRGLFYALSKLGVFVAGDIGCYTLGFFKPLSAIDSTICMGSSIGNAFGIEKALGEDAQGKVVAVIGDSTFIHSGIPGLINAVYNKGISTVIILDNRTTAMTGHQPNPVTGTTLSGDSTHAIDLKSLCKGMGVRHLCTIGDNIDETYRVIEREVNRPELSVIIAKHSCVLLPDEKARKKATITILSDKCSGCRNCLDLGCPAIEFIPDETVSGSDFETPGKGYARINPVLCYGCTQCAQVCETGAIVEDE
jgi:indolepyruvate ferredoxin oxidoreductase alpha subunit